MHVKRRIFKKEVKKEIPGLWAWKLLEKKCQTKRPGEDLVAFLICQSVDMDIICCHTSQKKEWSNLVFSRLVGLCSFWWISVCLYRSCRGVSKLIYGKSSSANGIHCENSLHLEKSPYLSEKRPGSAVLHCGFRNGLWNLLVCWQHIKVWLLHTMLLMLAHSVRCPEKV